MQILLHQHSFLLILLFATGKHTIQWKGRDDKSKELSSGVYFYRLQVDGKTQATRKCLLLK